MMFRKWWFWALAAGAGALVFFNSKTVEASRVHPDTLFIGGQPMSRTAAESEIARLTTLIQNAAQLPLSVSTADQALVQKAASEARVQIYRLEKHLATLSAPR